MRTPILLTCITHVFDECAEFGETVGHVIDQMLFKHQTPFFDDVEKRVLHERERNISRAKSM